MNNDRRSEIGEQVDQLEKDIAAQESARAASSKFIEQFIADCGAIFVEHASGVRILQFLEDYLMPSTSPEQLLKLSGENVIKHIAKAEGARQVVRILKAASVGNINATEGKHSEPRATQAT